MSFAIFVNETLLKNYKLIAAALPSLLGNYHFRRVLVEFNP